MSKLFSKSKKKCTCDQYADFEEICCTTLKERLNNCRIGILYNKQFRDFAFKRPYPYKHGSHRIPFCPWCGTKFPEELTDMWEQTLEKELGIINPHNIKQEGLIPDEFKTDEWWKKRGL